MARVPPTTTTAPSPGILLLLELTPGRRPAVRVTRRRLRRLRLDPAHPFGALVPEAVHAAHAREHDLARAKGGRRAVGLGADLAGEEHVRLLERVVVGLRRAADLVVDGEHREH